MLPPVVDAHIHWRDPAKNPYEALSDGVDEDGNRAGTQAQTYLPENYLADATGVDIKAIVHIEAEWQKSDPVGETKWLRELTDQNQTAELPLAIVGFADLSSPDVEIVLEGHSNEPLVRGIRQMLNRVEDRPALCWAEREYLDDPRWQKNYALLARHELDFDLMCFGHQMALFAKLAGQHPDIPVHLEHAGLPWDHSPEGREVWSTGMRALAALDHADVKISGLGNTIPEWNEDKIRDYVLETIDIFGVERVSFASNFPTDKQFSDMAAIWTAFDRITAGFSQSERVAMFAENAKRCYQLET